MSKPDSKASQPMDPGAREGSSPAVVVRNPRNAYALEALVSEVQEVFGEAIVEFSEPDRFGVNTAVDFECPTTSPGLAEVLIEVGIQDERLRGDVYCNDDLSQALVQTVPNRRLRDTAGGYGIAAILAVHQEDYAVPGTDDTHGDGNGGLT